MTSMLYPSSLPDKLNFHVILEQLRSYLKTAYGIERATNSGILYDYEKLSREFQLLSELIEFNSSKSLPVLPELGDVDDSIELLSKEGAVLSGEEIFQVGLLIEGVESWRFYFQNAEMESPSLWKKSYGRAAPLKQLAEKIFTIVEEDGSVKQTASANLSKIRKSIGELEKRTRKVVQGIYNDYRKQGFVPEGSSITIKNGRTTIPVLSEYKKRVSGYVQDESATGQTSFIEPAQLISHLNERYSLEREEKREIRRILANLCAELNAQYGILREFPSIIAEFDIYRSRLQFALINDFEIPEIVADPRLKLIGAYHPILLRNNQREGKSTIPLNLEINDDNRLIVISGPNAGGKSVALKTVGILQLMVQSGLPVPVHEDTIFGIFTKIMSDIGDDQSIDDDLSTYSSHLNNVLTTLQNADSSTLILFDEFGSGTEPRLGGSIAQASLEEMNEKRCKGIITTHYHNIKELAQNTEGMLNAAMRYNSKEMKPLYELELGKPGQSFAIQIAKKTGFSKEIIDRAIALAGEDVVNLDELLTKTAHQQAELEKMNREVLKLKEQAQKEKNRFEQKNETLDSEKRNILRKATEEADLILRNANKEIEKTIRHIKTSKAHKGETQKVRKKLENVRQQVEEQKNASSKSQKEVQPTNIKVGDRVRLKGQDKSGIVKKMDSKKAEIEFGNLTIRAKKLDLELVDERSSIKSKEGFSPRNKTLAGINRIERRANFNSQLNIRGMRAEVAIQEVDKFIDEAIMQGVNEVSVLHGKGEGVLRNLTRQTAMQYAQVDSVRDEHADRGGPGITIINFK